MHRIIFPSLLFLLSFTICVRCEGLGVRPEGLGARPEHSLNPKPGLRQEYPGTQVEGQHDREGRLFSMFSLINFPNDECTTSDSECGTCRTASECSGLKGFVSGTCAQGFGACCVLRSDTCGGTISNNRTYLRNPNYPSAYTTAGTCTWTLSKSSTDVCLIRLDFDESSIAQPSTAGVCTDYFIGTPAKTTKASPPICGENAGQHMYLDAAAYSDSSATLALTLSGTTTSRNWKIKVSMIECSSLTKPPTGCLQYFTGSTGSVSSFNYQDSATYTQVQSHAYSTCIRQEKGYCTIGWKQAGTDTFKMTRSTAPSQTGPGCNPTGQGDYVTIPNGSNEGMYDGNCEAPPGPSPVVLNSLDKFCGGTLTCIKASATPAEVVSNVRPFVLGVHTNNAEGATANKRGFKLNYRQIPC